MDVPPLDHCSQQIKVTMIMLMQQGAGTIDKTNMIRVNTVPTHFKGK
jgi:hypothetical protein